MDSFGYENQDSLENKVVKGICLVAIVCVVVFGVRFAVFSVDENQTGVATQKSGNSSSTSQPLAQKAQAAYQKAINSGKAEDWDSSALLYAELFKKNPTNGGIAARVGYSLHAAGRIDEAIEAHKIALSVNQGSSIILYNIACAYSLNREKEKSLKYLKDAIDAGFKNGPKLMSNDFDLAYVKDEPEFQRLEALVSPKKVTNFNRQFDFWVGSWNVYSNRGNKIGHSLISKSENGFLLTENWTSARGKIGTSVNFVDPKDNQWKQIWINQDGDITRYSGEFIDGSMQLNGTTHKSDGKIVLVRVSFTLLPNGRVRQFSEKSTDNRKTWRKTFEGFYRKDTSDAE